MHFYFIIFHVKCNSTSEFHPVKKKPPLNICISDLITQHTNCILELQCVAAPIARIWLFHICSTFLVYCTISWVGGCM